PSICFFFQAEDGIRDFHVTGVQTCALPISLSRTSRMSSAADSPVAVTRPTSRGSETSLRMLPNVGCSCAMPPSSGGGRYARGLRSEERRVGKEWNCRWWRYSETEKTKRSLV